MERFPISCYSNEIIKNTISIQLYCIDNCNFSCKYCCNVFPRKYEICNTDIVFSFIDDLSKKSGKHISLTIIGGEPTLHPNLISFCKKLTDSINDIDIEVLTNLSGTPQQYLQLLNLGVKLSASWHGSSDKVNLNFAKMLVKIPQRYFDTNQIEIRIMFEHDNWDNSIRMFKLLLNKFRQRIEISLLLDQNGKLYSYSKMQVKQYLDFVKELPFTSNELIIRYNDQSEKKIMYNGLFLDDKISYKGWKCNAGIDNLYIHVNGDVYNCERFYEQKHVPICNIISMNGKYDASLFSTCICTSDYCTCNLSIKKELIV